MSTNSAPAAGDTRGSYLKSLRITAGRSTRDVETAAKVGQGTVTHVEAGKRTNIGDAVYSAIATALGTDPATVLALPVQAVVAEPTRAILPMGAALPRRAIRPSPLNPRKRFDPAQLAELGESIRTAGIIEPILVRPIEGEDGAYWIVAGERRWRALETFLTGEELDGYMVPVVIREGMTDEDHLKLAIIENLQRVDVAPLEEAAAFDQLELMGLSKKAIATAIGKVPEYVQQRIRLLKRLCPEAQTALADRKINFTQALHLSSIEFEPQRDLLKKLDRYPTAERMRDAIYGDMVPVTRAIFDLADYKGAITENPVTGLRYFADKKDFLAAQYDAVKAAEAAYLDAGWSWVELKNWVLTESLYEDDRTTDTSVGGVYIYHSSYDGTVKIHEGLVKRDFSERAALQKADTERRERNDAEWNAFRAKLRQRLANDPGMVARLAILSLMTDRGWDNPLFDSNRGLSMHWLKPNILKADNRPLLPTFTERCLGTIEQERPSNIGCTMDVGSVWAPHALLALQEDESNGAPSSFDVWAYEMARRFKVDRYDQADPIVTFLARRYGIAIPAHLQPAQTDIEDAANAVRDAELAEAAE